MRLHVLLPSVLLLGLALGARAQTTTLFGKKADEAAKPDAAETAKPGAPATVTPPVMPNPTPAPTAPTAAPTSEEDKVVITPFTPAKTLVAKETRPFLLSKLNKLQAYETTRELQRLFSLFTTQNVVDKNPAGFVAAPGPVTTLTYQVQQDLGDNRYVVKANWPAVAPDLLAPGTESLAVLLLDHPAKVGATGKVAAVNAGKVALTFTAKFPPLTDKRLTLRREAFVECALLEDNQAGLTKFLDAVRAGNEVSVISPEKITCKTCGGLGFTREVQKGKLEDKRIPCTACEGGKVTVLVEVKFAP